MSETPQSQPAIDLATLSLRLGKELELPEKRVAAALALFDGGATVPFVARYRKEVTGAMDEVVLRTLVERRDALVELEPRRKTVLDTIGEQGKLTDELKAKILAVTTRTELEDLYAPYKPKRRTRATVARERGLEGLAALIRTQSNEGTPEREAAAYVNAEKEVPDVEAA